LENTRFFSAVSSEKLKEATFGTIAGRDEAPCFTSLTTAGTPGRYV
jgi:hypothetical protein